MERFENYFIIDYSPRRFKAKCKICEMIFIAKNFNDFNDFQVFVTEAST